MVYLIRRKINVKMYINYLMMAELIIMLQQTTQQKVGYQLM